MPANNNLSLVRRELQMAFAPAQTQALLNAFPVSQVAVLTAASLTETTDATLNESNLPELGLTLIPGAIYALRAVFRITATATPGIKFDFNAGDVTISSGYFNGVAVFDGAPAFTQTNVGVNALADEISAGATAPTHMVFHGVIAPTGGSLFAPRFAQAVSDAGAVGLLAGSFLEATLIGPSSFRVK